MLDGAEGLRRSHPALKVVFEEGGELGGGVAVVDKDDFVVRVGDYAGEELSGEALFEGGGGGDDDEGGLVDDSGF